MGCCVFFFFHTCALSWWYGGRNADKICVVEGGKVVESGKHDDLIKVPGGKYLQLVRLQLGGAVGENG